MGCTLSDSETFMNFQQSARKAFSEMAIGNRRPIPLSACFPILVNTKCAESNHLGEAEILPHKRRRGYKLGREDHVNMSFRLLAGPRIHVKRIVPCQRQHPFARIMDKPLVPPVTLARETERCQCIQVLAPAYQPPLDQLEIEVESERQRPVIGSPRNIEPVLTARIYRVRYHTCRSVAHFDEAFRRLFPILEIMKKGRIDRGASRK